MLKIRWITSIFMLINLLYFNILFSWAPRHKVSTLFTIFHGKSCFSWDFSDWKFSDSTSRRTNLNMDYEYGYDRTRRQNRGEAESVEVRSQPLAETKNRVSRVRLWFFIPRCVSYRQANQTERFKTFAFASHHTRHLRASSRLPLQDSYNTERGKK